MKKSILCAALAMTVLCGCTAQKAEKEEDMYNIDYMVLVNKLNPLPQDWEANLKTEHFTNTVGNDVEVEINAYREYLDLKKELEDEGIYVDLDSARRSVEAQQEIMDNFTKEYGAEYAAKIVAQPGYSEHHTGLALDLYLIVDGKDIIYNEDLVTYPEIWEKIHEKLAAHGFILRYLPKKEHITGYAYEPWHIRYIQDREKAAEIMEKGITLEGYLGAVRETEPAIDLKTSGLYSREELEEMAVLIKCKAASFTGCEMQSLTYAVDEGVSEEELKQINEAGEDIRYVKAVKFLMDFYASEENSGVFNPGQDYSGYEWLLGCDEEGNWEIVSWGL